jgi:hypothetical protein
VTVSEARVFFHETLAPADLIKPVQAGIGTARYDIHDIQMYHCDFDLEVYCMHAHWETEMTAMTARQFRFQLRSLRGLAILAVWVGGVHGLSRDIFQIRRDPTTANWILVPAPTERGRPR